MQKEKEMWKPVPGFESKYLVSNLGNLKSIDSTMPNPLTRSGISVKKGQNINPWIENGYKRVCLRTKGIKKFLFIHRLVAEVFIPKVDGKLHVNHIDGDRLNNSLENLEWVTPKENVHHAKFTLKRIGSNTKVVFDTLMGIFYSSAKEAHVATGSRYGVIHFRHLINTNRSHLIYC